MLEKGAVLLRVHDQLENVFFNHCDLEHAASVRLKNHVEQMSVGVDGKEIGEDFFELVSVFDDVFVQKKFGGEELAGLVEVV